MLLNIITKLGVSPKRLGHNWKRQSADSLNTQYMDLSHVNLRESELRNWSA